MSSLDETILLYGCKLGVVAAISGKGGERLWTNTVPSAISGTPCCSNSAIFVPTHDSIYKFCIQNGDLQGRIPVPNSEDTPEDHTLSLAISNGHLFISNGNPPPSIFNINSKKHTTVPLGKMHHSEKTKYSEMPAVGNQKLHFPHGERLITFDVESWTHSWTFEDPDGFYRSSPALSVDHGVLCIGNWDKNFYAINTKDGTVEWKHKTYNELFLQPAIHGDLVFVTTEDRSIYAFDLTTGEKLWEEEIHNTIDSRPAAGSNSVYFCGTRRLFAFQKRSGTSIWKAPLDNEHIEGPPLLLDDAVIVATIDGGLHAFNRSDGNKIWSVRNQDYWRSSLPEPPIKPPLATPIL
jgi:outer membrane protein assembly factor BamB